MLLLIASETCPALHQYTLIDVFDQNARISRVPAKIVKSVCYVESKWNIHAYVKNDGGSPSHGICQVKYSTARGLGFKGSAKALQHPAENIKWASHYLAYNKKRCGSWHRAIKAYNSGKCHSNNDEYVKIVMTNVR